MDREAWQATVHAILKSQNWLCWAFLAARGLSLVVVSGGYCLAVHGLLIAVASLVAEHRL